MNLELFVETALRYEGYPSIYCKGHPELGCDPTGFDCSGFIAFLLKEIRFPLNPPIRHVNVFFDHFGVFIHEEFANRGDLIFFSRDGASPTHIGIMIDEKSYIHAPGKPNTVVGISKISKKKIPFKKGVIYAQNPIGFKRLAVLNGRWQRILS